MLFLVLLVDLEKVMWCQDCFTYCPLKHPRHACCSLLFTRFRRCLGLRKIYGWGIELLGKVIASKSGLKLRGVQSAPEKRWELDLEVGKLECGDEIWHAARAAPLDDKCKLSEQEFRNLLSRTNKPASGPSGSFPAQNSRVGERGQCRLL